ncbi:hypothetical protein ROHU_018581 [Labeo rohita]|uniref:Uncharacterized protein n=1 Tax=Labeo rohita TaxID=84645 RepID=A0A498NEZ0_LABRO|nr:hypothetical protein ROHU_018581 [Labeo rohita]
MGLAASRLKVLACQLQLMFFPGLAVFLPQIVYLQGILPHPPYHQTAVALSCEILLAPNRYQKCDPTYPICGNWLIIDANDYLICDHRIQTNSQSYTIGFSDVNLSPVLKLCHNDIVLILLFLRELEHVVDI